MVSREQEPEPGRARLRVTLGGGLVLVLVALVVAVLVAAMAPRGATETVALADGKVQVSHPPSAQPLFVHIMGEVQRPGLYELREGDRAVDVVAAAGGFTDEADQAQLNLARFLSDGEQIIVPAQGEAPVLPPGGGPPGKVNINTADAQGLQQLAGVGPALADRIIAWRTANGRFSSVDDLLDVTGIGAKTLAGFRDNVTT